MPNLRVIKLGGSLLDLPNLPDHFNRWRKSLPAEHHLLITGGGEAADQVRALDRQYHLGDHHGHWLAIRAMSFNAHCIAHLLPGCQIVPTFDDCPRTWSLGKLAIIDPIPWLEDDERQGFTLPHRWSFTSDSIAAHIARTRQAQVLTLLKSTLAQQPTTPREAAVMGLVDADFPTASAGLPRVELVNLRAALPTSHQLFPDASER